MKNSFYTIISLAAGTAAGLLSGIVIVSCRRSKQLQTIRRKAEKASRRLSPTIAERTRLMNSQAFVR